MVNNENWHELSKMIGDVVVDSERHKVGKVEGVATSSTTLEPRWLVIKTSLLGRERVVPISSAKVEGDMIQIPYSKQAVLDSPVPSVPQSVAPYEDEELARYYKMAA